MPKIKADYHGVPFDVEVTHPEFALLRLAKSKADYIRECPDDKGLIMDIFGDVGNILANLIDEVAVYHPCMADFVSAESQVREGITVPSLAEAQKRWGCANDPFPSINRT